MPSTFGTEIGSRVLELVLDLLVDEEADDDGREQEQDRQQPGPDRPAPRLLLVVVVDGRRARAPATRVGALEIIVGIVAGAAITAVAASVVRSLTPSPRWIRSRSASISSASA